MKKPEQILNVLFPESVFSETIYNKLVKAIHEYHDQFKTNENDYTHISILLDASSSMNDIKEFIVDGFNKFIKEQKELKCKLTISLSQFSTKNISYKQIYFFKNIEDIKDLNYNDYKPEGMTSLNDSSVIMINETNTEIQRLKIKEELTPNKVLFVCLSDGDDNDSPLYGRINNNRGFNSTDNSGKFKEIIDTYTKIMGWEFSYIGANQNSKNAGAMRGMKANATMDFMATNIGVQSMFSNLSKSSMKYRKGADFNLQDKE